MANVNLKVVFRILSLILSSINIDFLVQKLQQRTYTIQKALSTTRYVKLVEKKEFAIAAVNPNIRLL